MSRWLVGYKTRERALDASRVATASPKAIELPDGSYAGLGDVIARGGNADRRDTRLYGARGTTGWLSEVGQRPGRKPRDGSAAIERLVIRLTDSEGKRVRAAAGNEPTAAWARARLLECAP